LNSVESRRDTGVPNDAGKVSRLRQVRLPAALRYAMLLAALLGLWQIYVTFVGQISLPGPLEVAGALSEGWSGGRLAAATWTTLGTLALGMLIGAMVACLLTVFAAWTRIGADLLTLLTLTLYPVPAIALLPLLILLFDTGPTSLIVVTVCSVTLPTAINLSAGLKSVNPTIMLVGQNLGLRGWGMFSAVLLPAALPHAISGLRAGWPQAGAPSSPPDSSSALQAGGQRSSPTTPATFCRQRSSSQDYLPSPWPASWSKRPSACWSAVPSSDGE
jgi:NitT/TauT family transport system permease protein